MVTLISLFAAFTLFTAYLIGILSKHGIQKSISATDYLLQKPFRYMFEITMWCAGISIAITGIQLNADSIYWLLVCGGVGIFLVGVFSEFKKNKLIKVLHTFSAVSGFTLTGLSFWLSLEQWYFTLIIAISCLLAYLIPKANKVWYTEVTLSYLIFIGLFLNAAFALCN